MLALDQSRSAWRIWALRGIGPTRAEEALGGSAFALCARDFGDRFQGSLRTDPAPLGVFGRSAGSVLRSLRRLWGGLGFRAVREGFLLFASKARCGPIPLRFAYLGRSAGSILRSLRRLWGGLGFRAVREGFLLFASKARCGPIPLRLAYLGAPRDRSYAR
jgi:hypothetical protein